VAADPQTNLTWVGLRVYTYTPTKQLGRFVGRKCDLPYIRQHHLGLWTKSAICNHIYMACLYAYLAAVGRRGWRMFYATLCDMVLYLHKDERSFTQNSSFGTTANAVRVHHALATRAADYIKKQHVFRLQAADWSQSLFQARLDTRLLLLLLKMYLFKWHCHA